MHTPFIQSNGAASTINCLELASSSKGVNGAAVPYSNLTTDCLPLAADPIQQPDAYLLTGCLAD
jgi:hypothetical protein